MTQDINKNVLVTGANGMVAYQLIKLLRDRNCNLTLTDLHENQSFLVMKNICQVILEVVVLHNQYVKIKI